MDFLRGLVLRPHLSQKPQGGVCSHLSPPPPTVAKVHSLGELCGVTEGAAPGSHRVRPGPLLWRGVGISGLSNILLENFQSLTSRCCLLIRNEWFLIEETCMVGLCDVPTLKSGNIQSWSGDARPPAPLQGDVLWRDQSQWPWVPGIRPTPHVGGA